MSERLTSTLRCPSCGAPASPTAGRCSYCHSALATVSCPACFGLLFDGTAYCPHCGAARSRTEGTSAAIRCPACAGEMRRVTLGATNLLECRACDGIWIDADVFERLCADREAQAAVLHSGTSARTEPREPSNVPVRYRPCARCGKLMNRLNFGRLSGAVIDVCRGHGTFLDRGELHQVVRFILDGGLDRARRDERERIAEERRALEALERQRAFAGAHERQSSWDSHSLQQLFDALFHQS